MRLSPLSSVEDGKLDILYTNPVSSWRILQLFASLPTGNHLNHPAVHLEQAKSVTIEVQNSSLVMIDGELEGHPPMEIVLIPSALEIFS
ncbi:hypothetical protein GF373_01930 [bacterium]|nr:hypothetical protein [bacterium]